MTQSDSHTTHDAEHDPRNDNLQIWVNGELVHKDAAMVSVYDSGFMLGDGMWKGLRIYDGALAFLTSIWTGCSTRLRPSRSTPD